MAKFQILIAIFAILAVTLANAGPQQRVRSSRLSRPRTRAFARQEAAAGADGAIPAAAPAPVTPYPSADEIKPEVPFDEVESPVAGPVPDEVYGPPDASPNQPDEIYGPPDQVYGPPTSNALPSEEPAAENFPAPLDAQQARLIAARRAQLRQRQLAYRQAAAGRSAAARPLKLRAGAPRRLA